MFSKIGTTTSTSHFSENIRLLSEKIGQADAIVIGAGAGLSASAGFRYDGKRFEAHFADFIEKYGFRDMYSAGFYPYETPEEHWAYWSRYIAVNRYDQPAGKPYLDLLELVKGRDYFVLTTNVDHRFQVAGFDKRRLFYTQGDFGLWQCSTPCRRKTYDNEAAVRQMVAEQRDLRVPAGLLPRCPVCGAPMCMNLRVDSAFVEDEGWHAAARRYREFLLDHQEKAVLYLELGAGNNTPGIIKYPFWQMVFHNPNAFYACINLTQAVAPRMLAGRSLCMKEDIGEVLERLQTDSL